MEISSNTPAVVSGAGSGLGRATAEALARKGAKVAIFDLDEENGRRAAEATNGLFVRVDISDPASVAKGLSKARQAHGVERLCVNCAGIAPAAKTVSRGAPHDADLFAKVVSVNLIGTFNLASQSAAAMAAAPPLGEDGERGLIVGTASVAAFDGQIGQIAYSASKAGVAGMTLPMARDLAKSGIRVMTIAPGIFETPMVSAMPQEVQDALAAQIPFPSRFGKAEEYARLVLHIAENAMLNGEVIRLDGAIRMQPK